MVKVMDSTRNGGGDGVQMQLLERGESTDDKEHVVLAGDCVRKLACVPDGSCRLVFADPPYNMGKNFGNNLDKWPSARAYSEWCLEWIDRCIPKLTNDGSIMIMGHPRYSSYLIPHLDDRLSYVNQIVYYYTDGMPEYKNFERRYEVIMYYRKSQDNFVFNIDNVRVPLVRYDKTSKPEGKNPNDVWQIHRVRWNSKERVSNHDGKVAHVAQKPLRLMRRIVLATTDDGDTVLDPFLGTGTTSVAAKELSRKSYGIEINDEYARIAKRRLAKTKRLYGRVPVEDR